MLSPFDVPKGKVIYSFEKVDMKRAKQILGGTACITGNLHTPLLAPGGKREQVVDATKRLIDDCVPGGGYIMSCSMTLDNVDLELLRAWKETTFTYNDCQAPHSDIPFFRKETFQSTNFLAAQKIHRVMVAGKFVCRDLSVAGDAAGLLNHSAPLNDHLI